MRVLRLNRCAALREVGFNIEEDGVVAKITGHMSIRATRCSDSDTRLFCRRDGRRVRRCLLPQ